MPALYQGTCSHCNYKTPIMTDGYAAVFVDHSVTDEQYEVAGAVIRSGDGGKFASTSDPRFVILSHPIVSDILAELGYTWKEVVWQGRFVRATNMICRKCGTVFAKRRLTASSDTGCLLGPALGIITGLAVGTWQQSIVYGLATWFVATLAFWLLADQLATYYIRTKFADRAKALAAESFCPNCHAEDAIAVTKPKSTTCPTCGTKSLCFETVGIS